MFLPDDYWLLAFHSTHAAMAAAKALSGGHKIQIIATPREVTAGCGMAIRYQAADKVEALMIAQQSGLRDADFDVYRQGSDGRYYRD